MYSDKTAAHMKKKGIGIGDTISIEHNGRRYEGVLLENASKETDVLQIKLGSGYNVGLKFNESLALVSKGEKKAPAKAEDAGNDDGAMTSLLLFGGTISSKVEYKTGAVFPSITPKEMGEAFPEMHQWGRVNLRSVFTVLSEDMNTRHWEIMGKEVYNELKKGGGIVATHGTDTMGYSAAALALMIRNPSGPIVLTGAQRSSDRGSSDNRENLLNSIYYSVKGRSGVYVCMHATMDDNYAHVHLGTRVRKMHTSRRDAFRSINALPVAEVSHREGMINYLCRNGVQRGDMELNTKFSDNVALIYIYPGIKPELVKSLSKYDGVVFAGTGLGHVPSNPFGDKLATPIIKEIAGLVSSGVHVAVAPQTINGRINLNVYTAGRMLKEAGVMGHLCDWLPETAFVKLSWVLGQTKDAKKVEKMMYTNYAGEIGERSLPEHF